MELKWKIFKILIILTVWIARASSRAIQEVSMVERHEEWMAQYGRVYEDMAEKEKRYKIFESNVEYIDMVNGDGNRRYKVGVNEFADLTNDEFWAAYIGSLKPYTVKSSKMTTFRYENYGAVPPSIDWRKKGAVTPIRGSECGAWTFPAVDTVEGITKIKTGKLYTLSVQEIVDCINGSNHGCTGGFTDEAFEFIKDHGLTTESNYPSTGTNNGKCNATKEAQPVAKIRGYESVPTHDENALMKAVANQPVAVYVDASGVDFQFYKGGVFSGDCGTTLDLGATVVGYGVSHDKHEYWLIKNSWGTSWGEKGYMRLGRGMNKEGGQCGVAMEATYPVV